MMAVTSMTDWGLGWLLARMLCGVSLVLPVAGQAQTLRDPTAVPTVSATVPIGAKAGPNPVLPAHFNLIFGPGDQWRILDGSRLLSVGDKIGEARLTRISETEVWLQIEGMTQKISRHPDVMISPETATPTTTPTPTPEVIRPTARAKKNETRK